MGTMYAVQRDQVSRLLQQTGVVKGQEQGKEAILATILARGHGYLLAPPGLAKTTLVKVLQRAIKGSVSRRLQMTADVRPRDIIGHREFDLSTQQYVFHPGPLVGANIVLVDEISRALGLTHAALLEAMQEGTITHVDQLGAIDLPPFFTVLATGNPLENEGVNPLPEALKDRFMTQITMGYGSREDELAMLSDLDAVFNPTMGVLEVMSVDDVLVAQQVVLNIAKNVSAQAMGYVVDVNRAARPGTEFFKMVHGDDAKRISDYVAVGPSPRGEIATLLIAAALVLIRGDEYIEPHHIKDAFRYTLPVRVIMRPEAAIDDFTTSDLVNITLDRVKVIA
ncbi:MoxR family ATPase [soil metagenome]